MKTKILLVILCAGILFSCRPTLYIPSSTDAQKQEVLVTGRKLYVKNCSSCHNLHFPKEYNAERWAIKLDQMQPKAKISNEDKQLILQFLTSQP